MSTKYDVEVTVISAKELINVNWNNGQNNPYAVIWIDPAAAMKVSTKTNKESDTTSRWEERFVIPFDGPTEDAQLCIDIVHAGTENDTINPVIGWARLILRKFVDDVGFGNSVSRTLDLRRPSGRVQGKVKVKLSVRKILCPAPALLAGESRQQEQGLLLEERTSMTREILKGLGCLAVGVAAVAVGVSAVAVGVAGGILLSEIAAVAVGSKLIKKAAETKSDDEKK